MVPQLNLLDIKKVYQDNADAKKGNVLPEMQVGDEVQLAKLNPEQHFTQPPARYSEATLIKTLEEIGVGTHERFIVDNAKFLANVDAKIERAKK